MKVLVTGAAGHLGRALAAHFEERGHDVLATDRRATGSGVGMAVSSRPIEYADITDVDRFVAMARGCDVIVHLAALGTPWASSEEEIFRVNALGSYCVFHAAALASVRRVVCASSINALGFYFGPRPVPVRRIPVDETHPSAPADPYSFSKQVLEEVAEYFFRREGIDSVCFRMGQNMGKDLELPDGSVRNGIAELLSLPRAEGRARAEHMMRSFFSADRDPRRRYDIAYPDHAIVTGAVHLWTCLDDRDRNRAFELAATMESSGAHVVNLCDDHNQLGLPSRELAEVFYPNAILDPSLLGTQSLLSTERARKLLGFEPAYSIRRRFA